LSLLTESVVTALAVPLSVRVQVADPAPEIDVGLQETELKVTAAGVTASPKVFDVPLRLALSVTVAFAEPVLVAENCAVVRPEATVTVGGTVTPPLSLLVDIVVAALAVPLSVRVQAAVPAPEIDVGLQETELKVTAAGVTVRLEVFVVPLRLALRVAVALCELVLTAEN
jgi:hypothetical protein